jgi:hypothetical protein
MLALLFSTLAITVSADAGSVQAVARHRGEVVVIWVKNLSGGYIESIELSSAGVRSFTAPSTWEGVLEDTQKLEFKAVNEPLAPGSVLRLKIVADVSPLTLEWRAVGKEYTTSGKLTSQPVFAGKTHTEFPQHDYEYKHGVLRNLITGESLAAEWNDVEMERFPDLSAREGYELKRVVTGSAGGDLIQMIVAVHAKEDRGFGIQHMNWEHGAFVFAPIESADEALQYMQFMVHETGAGFYDREYEEIVNIEKYNEVIERMQDRANELGKELEFLADPPTNVSRVRTDSAYEVERVFFKASEWERIIYSDAIVNHDGMVEIKDEYEFVRGAAGFLVDQ